MSSASYWFAPRPSDVSSSRLSRDFGVRSADLRLRERIVPGLGRVWFVRQLSWPVAAIALHASLRDQGRSPPRASAICHGVEALACKLRFHQDRESDRILGKRAFAREGADEVWDFGRLHRRAFYVQNTHRQAATKALRTDGGLGFADGSRFDLLRLTPVGKALADAFLDQPAGRGRGRLRSWFERWVMDEDEVPNASRRLLTALSPARPSAAEQDIVRARLLETSGSTAETRRELSRAIGTASELPSAAIEEQVVPRLRSAGRERQADEILAARAFGALLDRARDTVAVLSRMIEPTWGLPVEVLARDGEVYKRLAAVRSTAQKAAATAEAARILIRESHRLTSDVLASDDDALVRVLVARSGGLLGVDDGAVCRGPRFRALADGERLSDDEAADVDPDSTGRTFRIAHLHSLIRDLDARSEP